MIFDLAALSPTLKDELLADPSALQRLAMGQTMQQFGGIPGDLDLSTLPEPIAEQVRDQIADAEEQARFLPGLDDFRPFTLYKDWDIIRYLIDGCSLSEASGGEMTSHPMMDGGTPLGEDLGYGPANLMSPIQVKEFAITLRNVPSHVIDQRLDIENVLAANLYSGHNVEEDPEAFRKMYTKLFGDLRQFFANAASAGKWVVTYMS